MGRPPWLRRLAHGLVAGLVLSCLRAPLGLDWTQLHVVQGTTAALFRAAALLALAFSFDARRPAWHAGAGAGWLAAVCAGYLAHGLWLDAMPGSRAGFALLLLVATLALRSLAGKRGAPPAGEAGGSLARNVRLGLVLAGLGSALARESLAHETRLFTMATRADDAVVGGVFLALLAVGAAAFAPLLARLGSERVRSAPGFALAGGATLAGLAFLARLDPGGLHAYLRRIDDNLGWLRALDGKLGGVLALARMPPIDGASIGTTWATLLLSAAALVVPGFVLGATLGATRNVARTRHALIGAAFGLVLLPSVIRAHAAPLDPEALRNSAFVWELLVAAAICAAAGVALAASGPARERVLGLALALGVALVPWLRPRQGLWSFSPWSVNLVKPDLVLPTGEGLLTVERARDGTHVLTLDRRRLTPTLAEEASDERQLRLAWALLPEARRTTALRALFVGQLTPRRMRVLRSLGVSEPERTAPWHAAMPSVEELLFHGEEPPGGTIVSPGRARARLASGEYDWVIAPAMRGPAVTWKSEVREIWGSVDAPRFTALELPKESVGVAWIAGDSLARRGAELGPLLVDVERLETLTLGLVRGETAGTRIELGPWFECASLSAPGPLRFLGTMPQLREFRLEAGWAASLTPRDAADDTLALARGLALHFGAQKLSGPGESRAQQIELDEEALRALFAAVPAPGALDVLSRELWGSLAWILTEKRYPEEMLVYVEPVAERFAAWPELDRAVGHAYRELLEPAEAARFLERARTARPLDIDLLIESAQCAEELGDAAAAAGFLEQALGLQPGRPDLERALGLVLHRAGEARARALLERSLSAFPEDPELREALGLPAPANPHAGHVDHE